MALTNSSFPPAFRPAIDPGREELDVDIYTYANIQIVILYRGLLRSASEGNVLGRRCEQRYDRAARGVPSHLSRTEPVALEGPGRARWRGGGCSERGDALREAG